MGNKDIKDFCGACFNGEYPTGHVTEHVLEQAESNRRKAHPSKKHEAATLSLLS